MSNNSEIAVRIFDGVDRDSSILIGKDAHRALLGIELSAMLHRLGYETQKVANTQAVSEAKLVTEFQDYTHIPFPKKTSVMGKSGTSNINLYQAEVGLEVRPPLTTESIGKIAPFIARLLNDEKRDFVLLDDRGKKQAQEIYSRQYSARIIPLPRN